MRRSQAELLVALHEGRLVSGQVTCSCGWSSAHYPLALDAMDEYADHLEAEGVSMG